MIRKLASIVAIDNLQPIDGADQIEVATVKGWSVVVKKNDFEIGDHAIYCEIDSFLPIREEFEFLRKTSYRKIRDIEGFRLKTIKLRGQVSQGLLLPVTILGGIPPRIGDDVTEQMGITKYEPPIPASLVGIAKGAFPSFIPKTDEERIQNLSERYEVLKNQRYYVTEKLDGSSVTYYIENGLFGVCSRNLELVESMENTFWKVAYANRIQEKLAQLGRNIAFQGELIGEGIQGNPYRLVGQSVRFFYAYDIDSRTYLPMGDFLRLLHALGWQAVPLLIADYELPDDLADVLVFAEGASKLGPTGKVMSREGVVLRNTDRTVSFKAISNDFLLKNEK